MGTKRLAMRPYREIMRLKYEAGLARAGELLGIRLHDHVIIGNGEYVSLKERGTF